MNEPQMTEEQEALLDEAIGYAQLAEQIMRELCEQADALDAKLEKRISEAQKAVVPNLEG